MSITAADVNKLRMMTGAGMMDCKKALTEANGDFEAAIDILRKKGQKVSAARSDRNTTEGAVLVETNADATEGIIIALGCETDFVAKTDDFIKLSNAILKVAQTQKPADKDALIASKVDDRTVGEHITDLVGKIGEKIEIVSYDVVKGEKIVPYIHSNGKLGVLVALKNVGGADVVEAGKDVAMQIAAMRPVALDKGDVDATIIARELEIAKDQIRAEGKPEEMVEKIAQGKLNKFYKDSTLLNQEFVKDNSKSVSQYLDSVQKGLTVSAFKRITVA
jgi:elongation factor Ts